MVVMKDPTARNTASYKNDKVITSRLQVPSFTTPAYQLHDFLPLMIVRNLVSGIFRSISLGWQSPGSLYSINPILFSSTQAIIGSNPAQRVLDDVGGLLALPPSLSTTSQ